MKNIIIHLVILISTLLLLLYLLQEFNSSIRIPIIAIVAFTVGKITNKYFPI